MLARECFRNMSFLFQLELLSAVDAWWHRKRDSCRLTATDHHRSDDDYDDHYRPAGVKRVAKRLGSSLAVTSSPPLITGPLNLLCAAQLICLSRCVNLGFQVS